MSDRLVLTKNAQFYLPKAEVDEAVVLNILDSASENIEANGASIIGQIREDRHVIDRLCLESSR